MSTPKVHKKIYLMLEWLQVKLNTKYDILVGPFQKAEKEKYPNANFLVGPTLRGREDVEAFSIHVHRRVGAMKDFELFSSVLHELIHAIYWPVADSHSEALKAVQSKAMKTHLEEEMYDSREQATYKLERAIAPILYPEFLLDMEKKASSLLPSPVVGQKASKEHGSQNEEADSGGTEKVSEQGSGTLQRAVQEGQPQAEGQDA